MLRIASPRRLLLLVALAACSRGETPEVSRHAAIVPEEGGHPLSMALGDSLQLKAHRYLCHYDVCELEEHSERPLWDVDTTGLDISATGLVRARRAGRFEVRLRLGRFDRVDTVAVLPPVARLDWTARPTELFVGDTLRIAILARDSTGRVVGQLTLTQFNGGTGRAGEVVSYADDGFTVIWMDRPGRLELVGRLAHRTDTLRVEVQARAP